MIEIYLILSAALLIAVTLFIFKPRSNEENYIQKEAFDGKIYWVPIKKVPPAPGRKIYTHDTDVIDTWLDSLESSYSPISNETVYMITEEDITSLKKLINYKYGYIIE
jgi:hypothetical protein